MQITAKFQQMLSKGQKIDPKPLQQMVQDFQADDGSGTTGLLDRSQFTRLESMVRDVSEESDPFEAPSYELRWSAMAMRTALDRAVDVSLLDSDKVSVQDRDPRPGVVRSSLRDYDSTRPYYALEPVPNSPVPNFTYAATQVNGSEQQLEILNLSDEQGQPAYYLFRESKSSADNPNGSETRVALKADGSEAYYIGKS